MTDLAFASAPAPPRSLYSTVYNTTRRSAPNWVQASRALAMTALPAWYISTDDPTTTIGLCGVRIDMRGGVVVHRPDGDPNGLRGVRRLRAAGVYDRCRYDCQGSHAIRADPRTRTQCDQCSDHPRSRLSPGARIHTVPDRAGGKHRSSGTGSLRGKELDKHR